MIRDTAFAVCVSLLSAILGACASEALAAPPKVDSCPVAVAPYVAHAPNVDGKLSEAVWEKAARLGPFVQIAGGPAKNETVARVLRSDDVLFIGVTCGIPKGAELEAKQTARDSSVYLDESVEVFVDPKLTFSKYFHLIVNAANVQRDEDGDTTRTPMYDASWNGTWRSATSRGKDAAPTGLEAEDVWCAELAIPFSTLGLAEGAPAVIGLNVCRNDYTLGDTTCWSPTISGFHQPVRFGVVSLPTDPAVAPQAVKLEVSGDLQTGKLEQTLQFKPDPRIPKTLSAVFVGGNGERRTQSSIDLGALAPGAETTQRWSYEPQGAGGHAMVLLIQDAKGNAVALARSVVTIPESLTSQFGYRLEGGEALGLWWAESTYKIHRDKPMPTESSDAVRITLAGNEYEAAQIVLCPEQDVNVTLRVSDFEGPDAIVSADNFKLLEVVYVPVNIPSDKFGWVDDWPDPLPLVEGAVHCKAGQNQPFWLLASVSDKARPGLYRGEVEITAGETRVAVPVRLEVYDFALTAETHTRTAYGVGPNFGFQGVEDREQQAEVYDLFMQSCRDHRIAPYSPMRFHPMGINLQAPMRKFTCGRLAIEIEQGQQYPWKLYWDGEQIANQRVSQTHFARKGVGYKETGEGWPYINAIESVTEISSSPDMKVLEVVGLRTGSAVAARSFKLTFRLYIPAGDNWFGWQLVKMESTDETEITVRCYFNIPRTTFKAEAVANGKDFAAWSGEGVGFGMLCLGAGAGGLRINEGGQGVTVANRVPDFNIKKPQTHGGWGPLVIYFLTDKTSSNDLAARAEELRNRIDPNNPAAYVPENRLQIAEERRDDYTFTHDFTKFDEGATRYLDEFHFTGYNMRCMPGDIAGHKRFTDEYKRLHKMMYEPVIEHLREKGWLEKAYSYWFDEPNEEQYAYVIEGTKLLGENCPGLTRLLTEQPEEPLHEVIDLWVPVLSQYKPADCQARQEAGDLVWWYVCCGPRAPYPNNFVDHPAINHRIRFWMAEKYGVTGSLYWATTHYGQTPAPEKKFRNPWEDGMTYRPSGGYWGNGDGMLLYPPCREKSETPIIRGPVVSLRWEMLRDGIEDREYFWTLKQEIARLEALKPEADLGTRRTINAALREAKEALASPDRLATSLTKYTKDPIDLLREREGLARAIEACRKIK